MPPGAKEMQRLKSAITYTFEERPQGATVRMRSSNPDAVKAVHDFLAYQIKEHVTGDPITIAK